jgi:hypothetical protein
MPPTGIEPATRGLGNVYSYYSAHVCVVTSRAFWRPNHEKERLCLCQRALSALSSGTLMNTTTPTARAPGIQGYGR